MVLVNENSLQTVDIIIHCDTLFTSVHDALLYLNYAVPVAIDDAPTNARIKRLSGIKVMLP